MLERFAHERGVQLSPIMDSSNNQALMSALYASLGIAFLPQSYITGCLDGKNFKEIEIAGLDAAQTTYLVIHKNKKLNPLQQQAFQLIQSIPL
jgi:DNA-binding transcriptional LysR family regulator